MRRSFMSLHLATDLGSFELGLLTALLLGSL